MLLCLHYTAIITGLCKMKTESLFNNYIHLLWKKYFVANLKTILSLNVHYQ